jgi:hypothetical protein
MGVNIVFYDEEDFIIFLIEYSSINFEIQKRTLILTDI